MADDDIEVQIEEEKVTPEETTVKTATVDPVVELKKQYEELQAQTEAERAATAAARRETAVERQGRLAAEKEVESSRTEVVETRLGTVETGLASAQAAAESAKAEYVRAQEAGDWKSAADAQQKLSRAEAQIVRLDEAKSDLEVAKVAPKPETKVGDIATQTPPDPVEAFISGPIDAQGNRRAAESQAWLREHKDYITDPRKLKKLSAADMDAQAEGHAVNSAEYFDHVNKFLGLTKDGKTNGATNGKTARKSAPVAPVNATAGGAGGGGEVVKLSKSEAASATDGTLIWNYADPTGKNRWKKGDPIGVEELARRKLAMQKEGRYDPMNFIQM